MRQRQLVPLFLLLACSAAGANEQRDLVIHRQQVCPRDAEGWCSASSERGHFKVSFPVPFNDGTIRARDKDGNPMAVYVIGGTSPEGVKITVTCTTNPLVPATDAAIDALVQSSGNGATVLDNQAVTEGGLRGRQLHIQQKTSSSSAYIRIFQAHGALYQLIVEYPPAAAALAGSVAPRVFSSFSVQSAPEKP